MEGTVNEWVPGVVDLRVKQDSHLQTEQYQMVPWYFPTYSIVHCTGTFRSPCTSRIRIFSSHVPTTQMNVEI